jgi:hypothetical protein
MRSATIKPGIETDAELPNQLRVVFWSPTVYMTQACRSWQSSLLSMASCCDKPMPLSVMVSVLAALSKLDLDLELGIRLVERGVAKRFR